jgi:hypothetical protein
MAWVGDKGNKQSTPDNKSSESTTKNQPPADSTPALASALQEVFDRRIDDKIASALASLEIGSLKDTVAAHTTAIDRCDDKYVSTKLVAIIGGIITLIIIPLIIYIYQLRNGVVDKTLERIEQTVNSLPSEDRVRTIVRTETAKSGQQGAGGYGSPAAGSPSPQP